MHNPFTILNAHKQHVLMNSYRLTTLPRILAVGLLAVGMALFTACDVAVEPQDRAGAEATFSEPGSYESYLAKLYAGLNVTGQEGPGGSSDIEPATGDEGFSQYMRLFWTAQELPTEHAVIAWNDDALRPINNHSWGPNNGFSADMYNRIFFQVSHANEFLRQSTDDLLAERNVAPEVQEVMGQWRAEARFLRALSYWHGIDFFGDIPLVTEDFARGAEPPEQATREEVFNFIEQELLAITGEAGDTEAVLPPIGEAEYGRADRGAAFMLLAKLYLNAEVYVGQNRYDDVVTYTERILDSGAYSLEEEYHDLFLADNEFSPEFIFAVPQDGDNTRHFGGTTFLGNASMAGGDGPDGGSQYGLSGWAGLRITSAAVDIYAPDDQRPVYPNSPGEQFVRQTEDGERPKEIESVADFGQGYVVPKFQNVTSNGEPGVNNTHSDVDYPKFRLGDVHLMYAEAVLRGGGGSESRAVELVNDLRERAFGDDSGNISSGDLTLEFILEERSRELLWEGHRRTDRIRFGEFTDQGVWPWKGGEPEGVETESHRDLYPLPAAELRANPNLEQNPGYPTD